MRRDAARCAAPSTLDHTTPDAVSAGEPSVLQAAGMPVNLPPLPKGFAWRRVSGGAGQLTLWGSYEMARVEPTGRLWRCLVNLYAHPSIHQEAVVGSKREACYWVHCWAIARAEAIYRVRPEHCILARPKTLAG